MPYNIIDMIDKEEALKSIGLVDCDYALCTYHPVTMEDADIDKQIADFLSAMMEFPNIQFIVTKSNSDQGGARINELLNAAKLPNIHVFSSLGVRRYLSLMKYAKFVLGNSSSGIIETPALRVATVNIGDRQRGRLQSESIVNCGSSKDEIVKAIQMAMSDNHQKKCQQVISPYGDGHAAKKIAHKIVEFVNDTIDLKKKFYDLPEVEIS